MKWILAHWGWLTGGGLIIVGLILLAVFNLPAFFRLISAISGALIDAFTWVIREFRRNAWRASCILAALVCVALTWQWQGTRSDLVDARAQVKSVRTEYVGKLDAAVKAGKDNVDKQVRLCADERSRANTAATKRIAEIEASSKEREKLLKAQFEDAKFKYQREIERAKSTGNAITTGVRDGSVQLRDEWRGQAAAPDANHRGGGALPGTSGGAAGSDDAAELRATSAGEAIADAIRCDATITSLQKMLSDERATYGVQK